MEHDYKKFHKLVNKIVLEGRVLKIESRYILPGNDELIIGNLQGSERGFGFVLPCAVDSLDVKAKKQKEIHQDIYIHYNDLNGAVDLDTVSVRIRKSSVYKRGNRPEGEIVKVITRGRHQLVGTFHTSFVHNKKAIDQGVVVPDDKRTLIPFLQIPYKWQLNAQDSYKVVVKIHYGDNGLFLGEIIEILGKANQPGVDILTIIHKHDIPAAFSNDVLQETRKIVDKVQIADLNNRRDLRKNRILTIDGEDAKDLDDAVSIERVDDNCIKLCVHIADVSYYVNQDSLLDQEAKRRGCSVYLIDRVVPMLPPILSDEACSLLPRKDRLTITCEMYINTDTGCVIKYFFYPSIIATCERMTYHQVYSLLNQSGSNTEDDIAIKERYGYLLDDLELMADLADILRTKRLQRGALDFDIAEAKINLDDFGKPLNISKRSRTIAEKLIEEFMLLANETVASYFLDKNITIINRVHEKPDTEKLRSFYEFISSIGYKINGSPERIRPKRLQRLLLQAKGKSSEYIINTMLLRSMKQAKYNIENLGHFGLATTCYTHFTSPIRRYPDLMIHRLLRQSWEMDSQISGIYNIIDKDDIKLIEIANQSSLKERVAIEAERELCDLKKAEYMFDKIDIKYEGIISGILPFGFFVALDNTIEGLVHVSTLKDDYYCFDDKKILLIGESTGRTFRLGDIVQVVVSQVNLEDRRIDFNLLMHQGNAYPPQGRSSKRKWCVLKAKTASSTNDKKPKNAMACSVGKKDEKKRKGSAVVSRKKKRKRKSKSKITKDRNLMK